MERQEASGAATEQLRVTGHFLLKGTGFGAVAGPDLCGTTSQGDR